MARVKGGTVTHARHKKVTKAAKGYYGRRKNTFKVARQAVDKANQYATRDRKARKRSFRALWIQRINAAVRALDRVLTAGRYVIPVSFSPVSRLAHDANLSYPEKATPLYGDWPGFMPELWWQDEAER